MGIAYAECQLGRDRVVLCYCGDGATSQGDFHEALNVAGVWKAPTVFYVQNSQYALSTPRDVQCAAASLGAQAEGYGFGGVQVDGNDITAVYQVVREAVSRARAGDGPTLIEGITYRLGAHTTTDDPSRYRTREEERTWERHDPIRRLQQLLMDRGLLTETDTRALVTEARPGRGRRSRRWSPGPTPTWRTASATLSRRCRRSCRTSWHGCANCAATGEGTAVKAVNLVSSINDGLRTEMRLDERVVTFGEDVGVNGGVFRATVGLQQEFGPARCFDTPLAESTTVGSALGMAVAGLRPVVEIQFSGFIWPAFNQIINHVSRIRTRTQGAFTAPLVISIPVRWRRARRGAAQRSIEAILAQVPGIKVVIPSTPLDAKGLLIAAIRDPDPVIFMEPKRVYHAPRQEIPEGDFVIPLGSARVAVPGSDVTIVSYGAQMKEAIAAARQLRDEASAEVIDLRTIYPPDLTAVVKSVRKTGRLLVVHEGPRSCGVAAELTSAVTEQAFLHHSQPY